MVSSAGDRSVQRHPRRSGASILFQIGVVTAILVTVSGAAMAQPQQSAIAEFSVKRRDALRHVWRSDPIIRDHVEPGDEARHDAHSDSYSADYFGRESLTPMLALQPQRPLMDLAVARAAE